MHHTKTGWRIWRKMVTHRYYHGSHFSEVYDSDLATDDAVTSKPVLVGECSGATEVVGG